MISGSGSGEKAGALLSDEDEVVNEEVLVRRRGQGIASARGEYLVAAIWFG